MSRREYLGIYIYTHPKNDCLRIRTQKTKTEAMLPVSEEAYELCGTPDTGKVFKGLQRSMVNYPLKNWLRKAGIKKHITYHCFRHSYATLQIAAGQTSTPYPR